MSILSHRVPRAVAVAASTVLVAALAPVAAGASVAASPSVPSAGSGGGTVFFAADGLRQDLVAKYAAAGDVPTMASFLSKGMSAAGDGLLTQAPPNTGAGWYSLATGASPGVTGSTNNTFHINGAPFANRTGSFDAGVLQAETIAQSAERGGLKVAQVEWAGGRNGVINGPTIDFRTFYSGRGVATNYIAPLTTPRSSPPSGCSSTTRPGSPGRRPSRGGAGGRPSAGPTSRPAIAREGDAPARARLRGRQVRPERLPVRLHRTTARRTTTRSSCRPRRAAPHPMHAAP